MKREKKDDPIGGGERERDSNPRYVSVYILSRHAPSATRTSLQNRNYPPRRKTPSFRAGIYGALDRSGQGWVVCIMYGYTV